MKSVLLGIILAFVFSNLCFANFMEPVERISGTLPSAKCQIYWYFSSDNPIAERQVLAFAGLCDLYGDQVLGVAVVDNPKYLRLLDGSSIVGSVEVGHEVDPASEGLIIYSPQKKKVLFQAASIVSVEIVMQVLDRIMETEHSSLAGLEKLFRSIIESSKKDCADLIIEMNREKSSFCEVLRDESMVLILPPGCTECSLKKFQAGIEDLFFGGQFQAGSAYILSFGDSSPVMSLGLIDPEFVLSFPKDNRADIEFLASVPAASRLNPMIYTTPENGYDVFSKLEAVR